MDSCPKPAEIVALLAGRLLPQDKVRVEKHLSGCERCRRQTESEKAKESPPPTIDAGSLADTVAATSDSETESGDDSVVSSFAPRAPQLEGYRIIRELGRGGMGVVYEALQTKLGRRVALKVLPTMLGPASHEAVSRFRREASAAAKLHHTHIVPIYDFGKTGRTYYYAMELITGHSLTEVIKRPVDMGAPADLRAALNGVPTLSLDAVPQKTRSEKSLPDDRTDSSASVSGSAGPGRAYFRQVAQWVADVAEALHYAHSNGIIHRDIKPGNLMLADDGRIMILDFGLAKSSTDVSVTTTGSLIGTLRYMSPEQAVPGRLPVDHRTDIYSLGATMYELLTHQPVFKGRDQKEVLSQVITQDPMPPRKIDPHVPRELQVICLKALEKTPSARYETAGALAGDLRRYTLDLPISARPPGPVGRIVKFVRRRRAVAVAICASFLLIVAIAFAVGFRHRAKLKHLEALSQRREANQQRLLAKQEQLEAFNQEGVRFWQARDWPAAERVFADALKIDPDNYNALYNFACARIAQYNAEKDPALLDHASDLFDRAIRLGENPYDAWSGKGVILKKQGRYGEAEAAYRRAVELAPNFASAWSNLGAVLALQLRLAESEETLEKAVQLVQESGQDPRYVIDAWQNLGAVRLQLGKATAIEPLLESQKVNSEDPTAWLHLARAYLVLDAVRDLKKSLWQARGAESRAPTDPRAQHVLASVLLRREQYTEAMEHATQALGLGGDKPTNHLILAIASVQLGQVDSAREHLAAAGADWPTDLKIGRVIVTAEKGLLWFERDEDLLNLRSETEQLLAVPSP